MPAVTSTGITELLNLWGSGDKSALGKLTPLVLDELRKIARRHLRRERPGHTWQTTDLVNELYMRLVGVKNTRWKDRAQFFGFSAKLVRHVLVDAARERRARKRGGDLIRVTLEDAEAVPEERSLDLVALDDALTKLAAVDPRKAAVVELRFFGGLDVKETAEALHVAPNTVLRDWKLAKAWLWHEIQGRSNA